MSEAVAFIPDALQRKAELYQGLKDPSEMVTLETRALGDAP